MAAALAVLVAMSGVWSGGPTPVAASTWSLTPLCAGVNVRTQPASTAARKVALSAGAKVVAIATVAGAAYASLCGGVTRKGSTWYRITSINGKSVKTLYGVTYLYAAAGLFKVVSVSTTLYARCDGVVARSSAATTALKKVTLASGAKVVSNGSVAGGKWTAGCGTSTTGTSWYRIVSINGKSVKTLYGVTYLYVARVLLATAPPVAPSPSPSPSPSPTPTPSPTAIASASASVVPTPTPTPTPTPNPYMQGIDVSMWQTGVNYTSVAASGRTFVFIKASEGTGYADPVYATHRTNATGAGLVIGAYHFARPDLGADHGALDAANFVAKAQLKVGDLFPVLDLEVYGSLTAAQVQVWVKAFTDEIWYETGLPTIIYTSPSLWSSHLANSTVQAAAGDPLWVAHWTSASGPIVPASNWGGHGWTFWQYSDVGSVPGVSGGVDVDNFRYASLAPYRITAITPQPRPTPAPTPTPSPTPVPTPTPTPTPAPSVGPTPTP